MSKKILTALSIFVLLFAVAVTAHAQNNGNGNGNNGNGNGNGNNGNNGNGKNGFVADVQEKEVGGNNGFDQRHDIAVTVVAPEVLFVGMDAWIEITLTNTAGRAIPDVTVWCNEVKMPMGYDSKGKAFYNYSFSDGETRTVYIPIDTSEAGLLYFDLEVWTRLGNKNWQDLFFGVGAGDDIIYVEVVEQTPEFPDGIDGKGGDVTIDNALLFGVLPQTNAHGWMRIWVDGEEISGNGDFNTNRWTTTIKNKVLAGGVVEIIAETAIPNQPATLLFYLFVDENGTPIGAVLLDYCDGDNCEEDGIYCVCE